MSRIYRFERTVSIKDHIWESTKLSVVAIEGIPLGGEGGALAYLPCMREGLLDARKEIFLK